jgi:putative redox protein
VGFLLDRVHSITFAGPHWQLPFFKTIHEMSEHIVYTHWSGKLGFKSHLGKHIVSVDGEHEPESDTGPGPKALLLTSLTGCAGIDVAIFLKKLRQDYQELVIEARAPLTEAHPRVYTEIHLLFRVAGKDLSEASVRKAISLSMDKYCGVAAMLRAHCPVQWELDLIDSDDWEG